jgi:hypothetical protein
MLDTPSEPKRKKKHPFSTVKYTMAFLRDRGVAVRVVERWIPIIKIRKDLWGADLQAVAGSDLISIQCGVSSMHAEKIKKAISDPEVRIWLTTRNKFLIWTWGKRVALKKDGTRKLRDEYKARITELRLVDGEVQPSDFVLL